MQATVAKGGVESVAESMVSEVETHTPSSRGILKHKRFEDESFVALNGMLFAVTVTLWSGRHQPCTLVSIKWKEIRISSEGVKMLKTIIYQKLWTLLLKSKLNFLGWLRSRHL